MDKCTKCQQELTRQNTKHNSGGVVKWCDDCWKKFWDRERMKEQR